MIALPPGITREESSPQPKTGFCAILPPTNDQISSRCQAEYFTSSASRRSAVTPASGGKTIGAAAMNATIAIAAPRLTHFRQK